MSDVSRAMEDYLKNGGIYAIKSKTFTPRTPRPFKIKKVKK